MTKQKDEETNPSTIIHENYAEKTKTFYFKHKS